MLRRLQLTCLILPLLAVPVAGADLELLPTATTLSGPYSRQQLMLVSRDGGRINGDTTTTAKFATSNAAVAVVDENGEVRSVGDGDAVISATANGKTATARVQVTGTKQPVEASFRNQVIPI